MKKIIFSFLLIALSSCAHTTVAQYDNVGIKICAPRLMGCAARIVINNKSYLIDAVTPEARAKYEKLSKKLSAQHKWETTLDNIKGYTTKEKGHFPNPMAEFDVFKLSDLKLSEGK